MIKRGSVYAVVSSDRFGWPLGVGIDETGPSRPLGAGARYGNTDAVALNSGSGLLSEQLPDYQRALEKGTVMTVNDTPHKSDSEKRERIEQLEGIVRRLNPELTDEQFVELMVQFREQFGLTEG